MARTKQTARKATGGSMKNFDENMRKEAAPKSPKKVIPTFPASSLVLAKCNAAKTGPLQEESPNGNFNAIVRKYTSSSSNDSQVQSARKVSGGSRVFKTAVRKDSSRRRSSKSSHSNLGTPVSPTDAQKQGEIFNPMMPTFQEHACMPECIRRFEQCLYRPAKGNQFDLQLIITQLYSFLSGMNMLTLPLNAGWSRFALAHKVTYVSPCGRRFESFTEVAEYLEDTDSQLQIDSFTFEPTIDVSLYFSTKEPLNYDPDISEGKEALQKVPFVNKVSLKSLPAFEYITDVKLSSAVQALAPNSADKPAAGCECFYACEGACSCRKLAGAPEYSFKRLPNGPIKRGLYECNKNCHCLGQYCINNVVQQGQAARLQVFMTEDKGD